MTDALGAEAIRAALSAAGGGRLVPDGSPVGRRVEYHARVGSTNDRARELAASGEPEGTTVVAGEQTRGRGRADRTWHSAPGLGLYMSVLLRPGAPASEAPLFGLIGAVAAARALSETTRIPIRIKWPNDVVAIVEGEPRGARPKIAGILAEARTSTDAIRDVVIGIGVNVHHARDDFPADIADRAVSLRMIEGGPLDRATLAAGILTALGSWYTLWRQRGDAPVLQAYADLALDISGRRVRVTGGGADWIGTTAGLVPPGALLVVPETGGDPVPIRYGEVSRLEEA